MKKILVSMFIVLFLVTSAFSETYTEYKTYSNSAVVTYSQGILGGIILAGDGTNAVTIAVYNGNNSSAQKIIPTCVVTDRVKSFSLDVQFSQGIYVEATSSGPFQYTVYYKSR